MARRLEILIQVRCFKKGNKIFQHFTIVKTKYKKYLLNSRYNMNRKFEDLIEKNALSLTSDNFSFINRRDSENSIILEFEIIDEEIYKPISSFFSNIAGLIPFSDGCDECVHFEMSEDSFFCVKKQKYLERRVKNCRFFQQKNEDN